ncbi:MAG: hypothetical protein LBR76_04245 [Oscillospiraceae bacterium]|jgi:hypothetical protein|nr:hypothetical protein [Oscillospiraceae bacterium]
MKHFYTAVVLSLTGLFFLSVAVFTVFGEAIYAYGKPVVTVSGIYKVNSRDTVVYISPDSLRNDVTGDYVYLLMSEDRYNGKTYTVRYEPVPNWEPAAEMNRYRVPETVFLTSGGATIITETMPIRDGALVLWYGDG